mmetsp:Transcript_23021/g.48118  ORF Transcript_23021/g.48118 Transcript_23021/m.48118 type:complete len:320 (-) Transcript_23021:1454-2413(-)
MMLKKWWSRRSNGNSADLDSSHRHSHDESSTPTTSGDENANNLDPSQLPQIIGSEEKNDASALSDSPSSPSSSWRFVMFRRGSSANKKGHDTVVSENSQDGQYCEKDSHVDGDIKSTQEHPTRESDNIIISPSSGDEEEGAQCDNEFEPLIPVNETKNIEDDILMLWKRRRQRENGRKFYLPFQSLLGNNTTPITKAGNSEYSMSNHLAADARMEAGGGCNEDNLRSLDLQSHMESLKLKRETNNYDTMVGMEVMLAEEKEREDILYDLWISSMYGMDVDEEPEFGWDNLGWYETLTNDCDDEYDEDEDIKVESDRLLS